MPSNDPVYLCEEGCGRRVDQEGGTCLPCWDLIDNTWGCYCGPNPRSMAECRDCGYKRPEKKESRKTA